MSGSVTFQMITEGEQWEMFDHACRRTLKMAGDTFCHRWDAGEFQGGATPEMMEVLALRPHGR